MLNKMSIWYIPVIAALCYLFIELLKRTFHDDSKLKNAYPLISAMLGTALGVIAFLADLNVVFSDSVMTASFAGMVSGLSATGGNEIFQRMRKKEQKKTEPEVEGPPRYYITGDKHRHFDRLIEFCKTNHLRRKDVIVILGDSGFNYFGDERDDKLKARLREVNVTLFCLHGNKENRPENIPTYGIQTFCGGMVYYEPKYPNIFFAMDGEVYNFNGKEFMAIGGAHSVDRIRCLEEGLPFWEDEMPSEETKILVEMNLEERKNKIYGFLTHTCPISCLPTEVFISTKRAAEESKKKKSKKKKKPEYPIDINRSTEKWLETLKNSTSYQVWYCGHYHVSKVLGKIRMLHKEIIPFCTSDEEEL